MASMMSPNSHILWLAGSNSSTSDGKTSSRYSVSLRVVCARLDVIWSAMLTGLRVLFGVLLLLLLSLLQDHEILMVALCGRLLGGECPGLRIYMSE
jgi:hypothetical protein